MISSAEDLIDAINAATSGYTTFTVPGWEVEVEFEGESLTPEQAAAVVRAWPVLCADPESALEEERAGASRLVIQEERVIAYFEDGNVLEF